MLALRRILVPTEFADRTSPAIPYAGELADKFGSAIVLLHVVQDLSLAMPDAAMATPVPAPVLQELVESAKMELAHIVAREKLERFRPTLEVRLGSVAAEIVAAAQEMEADLICLGTHGRGAIAHFFLGSVAESIVRQAPCPVLTVKPPSS